MVDYAPELVSGLSAVLPTFSEPVDKKTVVPCITYTETGRRDLYAVNGMQYSVVTVRVRVWADDRAELQVCADEAEAALRRMGWRITGGSLLSANGRHCQILTCEATGRDTTSW